MVHIVADTTACLPEAIRSKYNITIIPQIVTFGEESFYEGSELDIAAFMAKLRVSSEIPKTAAPPPELFVKEFERLVPTGKAILCLHPSSEVSGTVRSATVAAMDFPGADIRVIDTRVVASPLATYVSLAAKWAAEGCDIDTIEARIKEMMPRCRVYFLVATLEYLARGGRIGNASALLGSVLQIKPILRLEEGKVGPFERERTHKRAVARMKEIVMEQINRDGQGYLSVMHADVLDQAQELANDLGNRLEIDPEDIPILDMPPAIVTHGGPGILGVGFFV
jgi:fatty acid kinase fatty acid binding subunit